MHISATYIFFCYDATSTVLVVFVGAQQSIYLPSTMADDQPDNMDMQFRPIIYIYIYWSNCSCKINKSTQKKLTVLPRVLLLDEIKVPSDKCHIGTKRRSFHGHAEHFGFTRTYGRTVGGVKKIV